MANNYDLRSVAGWFRIIAIAEAFSWIGLLVGMYLKHVAETTVVGVKIFGPIHGGIFMAFVVAALLVGMARKWSLVTWLLALLGSILPLGSVIFVMWADRIGRLDGRTHQPGEAMSGGAGPQPAPEAS